MEKHLLQAAERGDAEAQFNLAVIYENGLDDSRYAVEGSRPEAVRWFLAAAEQGLPRAQLKLAEIYAAEPDTPERLGKGLLLVSSGNKGLARRTSPKRSIRLPACFLAFDAGSDRKRDELCGKLAAERADRGWRVGSAENFGGRTHVNKTWFVPPIVVPILIGLGLAALMMLRAIH